MGKVGGTREGFCLTMIPFLKVHYDSVVQKDLVLTGNPRVYTEMGKPTELLLFTRSSSEGNYSVLSSMLALECLGRQKPYILCSGMSTPSKVVGCKITLRKKNLYNFLLNLNFKVLPRAKRFEGFHFGGESNIFSFSLKNMLFFEELVPFVKFFDNLDCLHCRLHFYSKNNKDVLFLGRSIFMCIV